jgi:hypothetical protein
MIHVYGDDGADAKKERVVAVVRKLQIAKKLTENFAPKTGF